MHDPWLVALSLLVAFQGSHVGLHLARGIQAADGLRRRQLITASALSLSLGIWTMHFVGMLALQLPIAADFLVLPTLISFLVCVLVVGFAVFFVGAGRPAGSRIALAALFMGGGIVTMHYLGMYALHAGLHVTHDPLVSTASAAIGVASSGAALWFGFGDGSRKSVPVAAAAMAVAIAAMHYTAMAGTAFAAHGDGFASGSPSLSPGLLAVIVTVVVFVVSGLFLLTLVPEAEGRAAPDSEGRAAVGDPASSFPAGPATEAADTPPPPEAARTLPTEKEGLRRALDVGRVVAVQAQGHYTQLFDGETTWFCPLAITEVEARLDPNAFARVHRSHLVRLDRIAAVRRAGDADQLALAGRVPYRVPVARSRRTWLRDHLRARPGAAE
ncbi:MAG TPA: MHYT domain-containing protein [Methylomirabilota bacterium]|nr:MHYT domain-containing protein [Methylomirabilota bacterium]